MECLVSGARVPGPNGMKCRCLSRGARMRTLAEAFGGEDALCREGGGRFVNSPFKRQRRRRAEEGADNSGVT